MPIPTDTYWNIKKLNIVFAISAVILMAVTGWSILQDFNQEWRKPQKEGKVWQAAFVDEKIQRDRTPELEIQIAELRRTQAELEPKLGPNSPEVKDRTQRILKLQGDQAKMEFALNNLKANVTVSESQLQDAITAKDTARAKKLSDSLEGPHKQLAADSEALFQKKREIEAARKELNELTTPLDQVNKAITKLQADLEAQLKKKQSLAPDNVFAQASQEARRVPLLQFVNPAEKVQQIVLPDILTDLGGFKKVETIDRCITCHVNVANKDFAEPKVLAYLEEQIATSRNYVLPVTPTSATGPAATRANPGAVAMPEFWHLYGVVASPEVVRKPANLGRISTLAKTVGKPATVTIDRKPLASFNYVPDPAKKEDAASAALDQATRDQVVAALLKAWIGYGPASNSATVGGVVVTLPEKLAEKDTSAARIAAMKYVEEVKAGMTTVLPADQVKLVNDRYRRTMVAEANIARKRSGLSKLDPSPVMLAHPRLDLYVDVDSKHSFEAVGCTSCHDGSGQETNFVLSAHSPRPIWVDNKTGESVLPGQIDAKSLPEAHHGADLSSMLGAVVPHGEVVPTKVADIHLELGGEHDAHAEHGEKSDEHASEHSSAKGQATTKPSGDTAVKTAPREVPVAPTNVTVAEETLAVTYRDPISGAERKAVPQMKYWVEEYQPKAPRSFELVYHEWDRPMRPPMYLQANCVRCHADVNDIKNEAPQVFEGRSLFINMGCINCHQMDSVPMETPPNHPSDMRLIAANGQRKVGTDLRNITAKLSPAYINTWIWAPKSFRPSTKMPHFFMLENNSSDEELRRTRQEARAITEYLIRTANVYPKPDTSMATADASGSTPSTQPAGGPQPPKNVIPPGLKADAVAGKAIFNGIGCMGCHTNLNDDTGDKRNGKPITLGEKWIVTDLIKAGELAKKMEAETGKAPAAGDLAKKATELYDHMTYNERQVYVTEHFTPSYTGEAPKYADNTLKPLFQHHGPELSGIGTKLTAGRTPEQARAWLYDWVKEPRHYSEYTVMPQLRLSDQQALDLTEYLLNQKRTNDSPGDTWKAELTPPDTAKLIELTSLFLRSRYSTAVATKQADDDKELLTLASDALITAQTNAEGAKAQASKLNKDQQRMVFLGKKLISNYGCMSCHAINGAENLSSPCANLSDWGQKAVDKLDFGYLDPHKVHGLPAKSSIPMVNGLSAKASHLTSAEWKANFPDGKVAEDVSVGWPHVDHSRTSWLTQKLKNTRVYDRGKVLLEPSKDDPGKPYDKLKMPTFYLSDREVNAIVTWVISNRDRLLSTKLFAASNPEQAKQIARGRQLAQKYNCVACHIIEGNQPSVQQYYKPDDMTVLAPPSLRGEGNKIQHTWLFNFLKHVEPLRPKLFMTPETKPGIRMPSFPILDQEATDIAAYFAAASLREANALKKQLVVINKYRETQAEAALKFGEPIVAAKGKPKAGADGELQPLVAYAGALIQAHKFDEAVAALTVANEVATKSKAVEQVGATTKPVSTRLTDAITTLKNGQVPDSIPWPGDDWWQRPEFASSAQALRDWALANKQISDIQLDPTKNKPAELAKNHRLILFKATFTQGLYDAPYPFVDTPRPEVSEERFKKGEAFFYELQCLKCHVLGDPNVPGAQKNPTAPNLGLAQRRLQRRWVRDWVQEPPVIQIGTAMPPFFTGLNIFDIHGQAWPRSQGVAKAEVDRVEALYGKSVEEQTALLLDFLYAAGMRGYTGIQPAAAPTPAATATPAAKPAEATTPKPAPIPEAPKEAPKKEELKKEEPPKEETKKEEPKPAPKAEPAPAAKPQAAGGAASVTGKVSLDGKAPEMKEIDMAAVKECASQHPDPVVEESIVADAKGNLKNVVVYVTSGLSQTQFDPPAEAAVLDQKGCMYQPHVLPVMVGQKIVIKNDDAFLHNVHSLSATNPPFNFGQPNKDNEGKEVAPLKAAETFRIKCDVHSWMSAYIVGLENPYFGVSADDGSFSIANLPPGDYTLTAWHEQLGTKEVQVKVEAGKPASVEIKFPAP